MRFTEWEELVNAGLTDRLGVANVSRSALASGLVVWRTPAGATVTAGPDADSGCVYLSFSDGAPAMLVALDAETERAASYIATRLVRN